MGDTAATDRSLLPGNANNLLACGVRGEFDQVILANTPAPLLETAYPLQYFVPVFCPPGLCQTVCKLLKAVFNRFASKAVIASSFSMRRSD